MTNKLLFKHKLVCVKCGFRTWAVGKPTHCGWGMVKTRRLTRAEKERYYALRNSSQMSIVQ